MSHNIIPLLSKTKIVLKIKPKQTNSKPFTSTSGLEWCQRCLLWWNFLHLHQRSLEPNPGCWSFGHTGISGLYFTINLKKLDHFFNFNWPFKSNELAFCLSCQ